MRRDQPTTLGAGAGARPPEGVPGPWSRVGVELELLAPRGSSRAHLAHELSRRCGGTVHPVFHADSEPSLVPGMGQFLHLTRGLEVRRDDGRVLCTLVDDITINGDLDQRAAPRPGWYRVLSDDRRLLRLVAAHADPAAPLETVLDPVAALFGVQVQARGAVRRVNDGAGATIALAAPQPGERERPCEVVTPPLERDHLGALEELLAPARELGFVVPREAAVHLHLDGAPFRSVHAFANVVRLFARWRDPLWRVLGTNPACVRLRPLPEDLVRLVEDAGSGGRGWDELRRAAGRLGLTKFFDVNLTSLLAEAPTRDTLEVRILPGMISGPAVVRRAALVDGLLRRCQDPRPLPAPPGDLDAACAQLERMARAGG